MKRSKTLFEPIGWIAIAAVGLWFILKFWTPDKMTSAPAPPAPTAP